MNASHASWNRSRPARRVVALMLGLAALTALVPASQAQAAKRFDVPEESPGIPAYARLGGPNIAPHTDDWAAIAFFRDPACVPPGFNLLDFFDVPRVFGCPLTVEGFEIWRKGPGQEPAPRLSKLREAGPVPVWFVSWPELQAAAADGVLTITELSALPSLIKGLASRFRETLRPFDSNGRGMINLGASGSLSDGRSFRLKAVVGNNHQVKHVSIRLR